MDDKSQMVQNSRGGPRKKRRGFRAKKEMLIQYLRADQISERGSALGCANAQHELSCMNLPRHTIILLFSSLDHQPC